jgi:hypothetical protein
MAEAIDLLPVKYGKKPISPDQHAGGWRNRLLDTASKGSS